MDLHAWITERVDSVEASVLRELEGRRIALQPTDGSRPVGGTVTVASAGAHGPHLTLAQYTEPRDGQPAPVEWARAVLRRCEADRRVLARHRQVDESYSVACEGCGYDGGYCPEPVTANVSDCPELLDLAHAHGIASEILAGLDRPKLPERETTGSGLSGYTVDAWASQIAADLRRTHGLQNALRNVPPALRGPNWREGSE